MRHDVSYYITDCLMNGNRAEITLARIAEQRATDPQVKQFAERMIQEHTAFLNKLQSAQGTASGQQDGAESAAGGQRNGDQANGNQTTGNQATGDRARGDQANQGQGAVGASGVDVNAPGAQVHVGPGDSFRPTGAAGGAGNSQAGGARQFLHLQKEVEAQCLQSKTRELSQKEGAQFDRCYMNSQVAAHMKMADELTVYSRNVSENLQSTLQEGLQTTKQHLAMAKQIAERLEGATPSSASRTQNAPGQ
jgi:predicted outer membrane protein